MTPRAYAAAHGYIAIVQAIDEAANAITTLLQAVAANDLATVTRCLAFGTSPNVKDEVFSVLFTAGHGITQIGGSVVAPLGCLYGRASDAHVAPTSARHRPLRAQHGTQHDINAT